MVIYDTFSEQKTICGQWVHRLSYNVPQNKGLQHLVSSRYSNMCYLMYTNIYVPCFFISLCIDCYIAMFRSKFLRLTFFKYNTCMLWNIIYLSFENVSNCKKILLQFTFSGIIYIDISLASYFSF